MIIQVMIASQNPAKIEAVKNAFSSVFPDNTFQYTGVSVPSGVAEQPMTDSETHQGALNRVINTKRTYPDADFYVGIEAGFEDGMTFAWMVIESDGHYGESRSSSLMLPQAVVTQINEQNELGSIMDTMFGTTNIKQKGGAIGLFTNALLTRSSVYYQALVLALTPFANPDLFSINTPRLQTLNSHSQTSMANQG